MVVPLVFLGAAALLGGGIGTGLAFSGDEVENTTYQTTNQTSNYNKKVSFNFSGANFEEGSNVSITDTFEPTSNQSATQENTNDNQKSTIDKKLLLAGGLAIGLYFILGGKK